ncbi:MAG: Carboxymethylenebutenolidase [Ilumatobacteraceae bacterium]|nr:Carboxymethylenebutenolidase [Ilumatobacteraceae bacterium]
MNVAPQRADVFAEVGGGTIAGMAEMIEFASNGGTAQGYLAGDSGPGVLVIQEWWGLNAHIKDIADRFAAAGFTALAPDLYHGQVTTEPDGAGKLMMSMNIDEASKDMSGAIDELQRRTGRTKVGVIGFCMGGGLALVVSCKRPDAVAAVAPFYGLIPWAGAQPDWTKLAAKVEGHYAADDHSFPPPAVEALQAELRGLGKDATLFVYPEVDHAFFNDTRPEVYSAETSKTAWLRVLDLFHSEL